MTSGHTQVRTHVAPLDRHCETRRETGMKRPMEISLQLQQRINVLFCVKLNLSLKETRIKINAAYGQNSISYSRI